MRTICSVKEAHRQYAAAHARLLAAIGAIDLDDSWVADGAADLPAWLSSVLDVSYLTARAWVESSRALRERPALASAYQAGSVSCDQMQAISTLSKPGSDDDELWLEAIHGPDYSTIGDLQREARKQKARQLEGRDGGVYLRMTPSRDERFIRVRGQVAFEDGLVLMKAVDRRVPKNAPWQTIDRHRADGIIQLAKQKVAADPDRNRSAIVLAPDDLTSDEPAWVDGVGYLPAESARRIACDARTQTPNGKTSDPITPATAREVRARDKTCVFPGCERNTFAEIHHVKHRAHGGPPVPSNLVLTCHYHHKLVHEGGWKLEGQAGPDITWIRPDGKKVQRGRAVHDTS